LSVVTITRPCFRTASNYLSGQSERIAIDLSAIFIFKISQKLLTELFIGDISKVRARMKSL
jgi:hypothetical protein